VFVDFGSGPIPRRDELSGKPPFYVRYGFSTDTNRPQRSENIVQRIRTDRTLHGLGRALHAGARVAVTCNAIHLGKLTFCA
jgi:hypothetical protein